MNKKDLLVSYIFAFATIPFCFQLKYTFQHGAVVISLLLVIFPLYIYLTKNYIPRKKVFIKFNIDMNKYPCSIILFFLFIMFFSITMGYTSGPKFINIATTNSIKQASLIEDTLSNLHLTSVRQIEGSKYTIFVINCDKNTVQNIKAKFVNQGIIVNHTN